MYASSYFVCLGRYIQHHDSIKIAEKQG